MSGLIYIGKDRVIPGIPPRDLTEEEVKQHGGEKVLVGSGLYSPTSTRQTKKTEDKT
jgi:hypothetical protein